MLEINKSSLCLVGYGVSNKALCKYFLDRGVFPTVRCPSSCPLPAGAVGVFGEGYLDIKEETVFRSPGVHPRLIKRESHTEVELGLGLTDAYKIGITGSDGKTTTCTLAYLMLSRGGRSSFLGGNIGKPVISVAPMLKDEDFLVCELSSFQLYGYAPQLDVGVITTISENHLDYHSSMEDYVRAKENVLKNAKRRVLNYDDQRVRSLGREGDTYFSLRDCSSYVGKGGDFVHMVDGRAYYNHAPLFFANEVMLKGGFNLQNLLCAAACVYPIVGAEAVRQVAREFCGVENRQEEVAALDGVTYICSAIDTTPERTKSTLSAYDVSRVVAILGGSDKNLSYEPLGDVLKGAKAVILCGENSDKIERCLNRPSIRVNTIEEAVAAAHRLCRGGDFVILTPASASFDMFENYKEKAKCFKNAVKGLKNGENQKDTV